MIPWFRFHGETRRAEGGGLLKWNKEVFGDTLTQKELLGAKGGKMENNKTERGKGDRDEIPKGFKRSKKSESPKGKAKLKGES